VFGNRTQSAFCLRERFCFGRFCLVFYAVEVFMCKLDCFVKPINEGLIQQTKEIIAITYRKYGSNGINVSKTESKSCLYGVLRGVLFTIFPPGLKAGPDETGASVPDICVTTPASPQTTAKPNIERFPKEDEA